MRYSIMYFATAVLTVFTVSCGYPRPQLKHQFVLLPDMIINESGCGYGTWIADEQQLAGEPNTFWDGYDKEVCAKHDASLIIDLGQKLAVAHLHLYSANVCSIAVSSQTDSSDINVQKVFLSAGWNKIALEKPIRFISISTKKGSKIGEILIETDEKQNSISFSAANSSKTTIDQFMGTNAFVDVPLGLLEPFGCIREYHDWPDWNEPVQDAIQLNSTSNGFNFQHFYSSLGKMNKTVIPVIQKSPQWLTEMPNSQAKPLPKNDNPLSPHSYKRHAYFMSCYAQNFAKEENGKLLYYENWNEPDKWWEQSISYFTPYEYASLSSADKDGHHQEMGENYGIASANGKLVMAGLASGKLDYLRGLKHWCDLNRNGNFAWDVINYHQYANTAGLPDGNLKQGVCPEKGRVYEEAKNIVLFRDKHAPEAEVWNTEFGYDTQNSPQQCWPIGDKNSELVQADWLIRSYLLLSAAGIEKAFQFMIRDAGKSGLYATSGLYSSTLQNSPYLKPSWNYLSTFKSVLTNSYFVKLKVDSSSRLYEATYRNKLDSLLITKVIWYGTQTGKISKGYRPNTTNIIQLTSFHPQNACGLRRLLKKGEAIEISETPLFLQLHPKGIFPKCGAMKPMASTTLQCVDENGQQNDFLFDEQGIAGNPAMGLTSQTPSSGWRSSYKKNEEVVIDMGHSKHIPMLYIFDGASDGEITISIYSDLGWTEVAKLRMNHYNKWKPCVINGSTSKIRLSRTSGNAEVGEVVVYEKDSD